MLKLPLGRTAWFGPVLLTASILLAAPEAVRAMGCNIEPFPDKPQRAQSSLGEAGNGLVDRRMAGPGDWVTLIADLGCKPTTPKFRTTDTYRLEVLAQGGSFVEVPVDQSTVQLHECPTGQSENCGRARFPLPDPVAALGIEVAGPARLAVDRGTTRIYSVGQLAAPGTQCDADNAPADVETGGFVFLPPMNVVQEGANAGWRLALDWQGDIWTPQDMTALVDDPGAPQAVLTESQSLSIDLIPTDLPPGVPAGTPLDFVEITNDRGQVIPPLEEVVVIDPSAPRKAILGSTDVLRSVLELRQQVTVEDASGTSISVDYPVPFAALRVGAGPIIAPDAVSITKIGTTDLTAFRTNDGNYVAGVEETPAFNNGDGDLTDALAQYQSLEVGATTLATGQALAQISGSPRTPAIAVEQTPDSDIFAFVQGGVASREQLTPAGSLVRDAVRVYDGATELTPNPPLFSIVPERQVEGGLLSIAGGTVFSIVSEPDLLPDELGRVTDDTAASGAPRVDAAGERVAHESQSAGGVRQIVLSDREGLVPAEAMSPVGGPPGAFDAKNPALAAASGDTVAFQSRSTYGLPIGGGSGGGGTVVVEQGVNFRGRINADPPFFFPDASLLFDLLPGEDTPGLGDWSGCTPELIGPFPTGIELIFLDDPGLQQQGTFMAYLSAPYPGVFVDDCHFEIQVVGIYQATETPPVPGTVLSLAGDVVFQDLDPALPGTVTNPRFESTLIVGDPVPAGHELSGFFALLAEQAGPAVAEQVFLAVSGTPGVSLLSANAAGDPGDGDSGNAELSSDGGFAAYDTASTNLVASAAARSVVVVPLDPDGNGVPAEPGTLAPILASVDAAGAPLGGTSSRPRLSRDGLSLVFLTDAPVDASDTNASTDAVFVDLDPDGNGSIEPGSFVGVRVSTDALGQNVAGTVFDADLGGDGTLVAFSGDGAYVPDDGNGASDVYLLDLADGTLERISVDLGLAETNGASDQASVSDDQQAVVFRSDGALLPGATGTNVYRFLVKKGGLELVSLGATAAGRPDANADGNVVVFDSADPLVPGDAGAPEDVFALTKVDDGTITSLNDFPGEGLPDDDLGDPLLEAFDTTSAAALAGSRIAANSAQTAPGVAPVRGLALVSVPEDLQGGLDLNDATRTRLPESATSPEADADDDVLFLYRARDAVGIADAKENLGVAVAGEQYDLSSRVACFAIDEADQSTELNGNASDEAVLGWITTDGAFGTEIVHNAGFAVQDVAAVDLASGPACLALVDEARQPASNPALPCIGGGSFCDLDGDGTATTVPVVLDTTSGAIANVGLPATGFELGPEGHALFLVPEAVHGVDANGNGVLGQTVPWFLDLDTALAGPAGPGPGVSDLAVPLGPAWAECSEPACEAFGLAKVGALVISYAGRESDNRFGPFCRALSGICDANADGRETKVIWTASIDDGVVSRVVAQRFDANQSAPIHPVQVAGRTVFHRELTECAAAELRCQAETGFATPEPSPEAIVIEPGSCESAVDVVPPFGELGCIEPLLFLDSDLDGDGVKALVDNSPFSNTAQRDGDNDGYGDGFDLEPGSLAPVFLFDGDFDGDGDVDQDDLDAVQAERGRTARDLGFGGLAVAGFDAFDLNLNGVIDIGDVLAVINRCTLPGCEVIDPAPPAAPAGGSGARCGLLGLEPLVLLAPWLARRWRRRD